MPGPVIALDENFEEKSNLHDETRVIFLCLLVSFTALLSFSNTFVDLHSNASLDSSSSSFTSFNKSRDVMAILIDVHISAQDGHQFPSSHMQCLGVHTFIMTRKSHKMDLVFFHNHNGTLHCAGIESWEGTGVRFVGITLQWFEDQVAKLNVNAREYWPEGPQHAMVCDFKPLYGHIFSKYIEGYPFWAYGDMDGIFGHTTLFDDSLWKYDIISSYCNTNKDFQPPTKGRSCTKGWAAGPLMILKNNKMTRDVVEYSLDTFWRELFKVPIKKMLDEQWGGYANLHRILRGKKEKVLNFTRLPAKFNSLKQFCSDACTRIGDSEDMFVFNLIPRATDVVPLKFRWTKASGTMMSMNGTEMYRIHFLHWSHWKYDHGKILDRFVTKLYWSILHLDCFEIYTVPLRLELCSEVIEYISD